MKSKHLSAILPSTTELKTFLFAVCLMVFGSPAAIAAGPELIEYEKATLFENAGTNQILSRVVVGPSAVTIGGFGVYGKARADGNIKFIIFDAGPAPTQPRYISNAQSVQATTNLTWYDLADPTYTYTLKAGQSYGMGLIADRANSSSNSFQWAVGYNSGFGGDPRTNTTANGLTLPWGFSSAAQWLTLNAVTGCTNGVCSFGSNPTLFQDTSNTYKPSLHIYAVPEPAEWMMLVAGLLTIGFIAARRNRNAG
jgi:hypothetical protein